MNIRLTKPYKNSLKKFNRTPILKRYIYIAKLTFLFKKEIHLKRGLAGLFRRRNSRKIDYKKAGNRFHKKLEKILHKSGLRIIKSEFNEKGPDIIADLEGKKIIIQCKHSPKGNFYTNLEDEVDSYSTKVKKYGAECAVIALSGYKIKKIDQVRLEKWLRNDNVAIWTDIIIKNYDGLTKSIGKYSKYQIAADLYLNIKHGNDIVVRALEIQQKRIKFFITKLSPKYLLQTAYVARRAQGPSFYQRYLAKKRVVNEIPDFIDNKKGTFPNSIILVSQNKLKYENDKLILPNITSTLWVIDGQHRLYAFCNIKDKSILDKYELVCTIFDGGKLDVVDQADIFLQINTKAKKVDPPLIIELAKTFGFDFNRRAIFLLKKFEKTPYFENKIRTYTNKIGSIDQNTFCMSTALTELIKDGGSILKGKNKFSEQKKDELCYNYLYSFFKIVYINFKREWNNSNKFILSTNQGYRSLLRLFIKILYYTKNKRDVKNFRFIIKAFKKSNPIIDNIELKGKFAGEGGASKLADEWSKGINKIIHGFDKTVERLYGIQVASERIYKGELKKAEDFIEYYSKDFKGTLRGELEYIDFSTLNYLEKLFKNCNKFHIVFSHIKKDEKNKFNNKLRSLNEKNKMFVLTKCDKLHERWLGTENFAIELKADLKKDALANSDHEIAVFRFDNDISKIIRFDERWDYFKGYSGRKITYDWSLEKENEL